MIDTNRHTIAAADSAIKRSLGDINDSLIHRYLYLEVIAAVLLFMASAHYILKHDIISAAYVCLPGLIFIYDFITLRYIPSYTIKRRNLLNSIAVVILCASLHCHILSGLWLIPLSAASFYIQSMKRALWFNAICVGVFFIITHITAEYSIGYRTLAILITTGCITSFYSDVINLQKRTLALQSITDPLTGAYSRLHFNHSLQKTLDDYREKNVVSTIVLLDIDNFKFINTTYGHDGGDKALVSLVDIVKAYTNPGHELFRYGGDEFVLIFHNMSLEEAQKHIELIEAALKHVGQKEGEVPVSFSAGYATTHKHTSWEDILNTCDQAMYNQKNKIAI